MKAFFDGSQDFIEFDCINAPSSEWERLYFTLRPVSYALPIDGLYAALGAFSLRALASGYAENLYNGKWRITVEQVGVFVHDVFNFQNNNEWKDKYLGWWSCKHKNCYPVPPLAYKDDYVLLSNADFEMFSEKKGVGKGFLVLSNPPHIVEKFKGIVYEAPRYITL